MTLISGFGFTAGVFIILIFFGAIKESLKQKLFERPVYDDYRLSGTRERSKVSDFSIKAYRSIKRACGDCRIIINADIPERTGRFIKVDMLVITSKGLLPVILFEPAYSKKKIVISGKTVNTQWLMKVLEKRKILAELKINSYIFYSKRLIQNLSIYLKEPKMKKAFLKENVKVLKPVLLYPGYVKFKLDKKSTDLDIIKPSGFKRCFGKKEKLDPFKKAQLTLMYKELEELSL